MAIDTDLSTPLLQVRAIIGDTEGQFISDQTIDALLLANGDNVALTAIQSLEFIVADLAKKVRQEVGDVEVWCNQMYEHYRQLLIDLTTNPTFMVTPALHILGGTSCSEANRVNWNPDSRNINIREGFGTKVKRGTYLLNSYFLSGCGDC